LAAALIMSSFSPSFAMQVTATTEVPLVPCPLCRVEAWGPPGPPLPEDEVLVEGPEEGVPVGHTCSNLEQQQHS
jgi:hypothetical protein